MIPEMLEIIFDEHYREHIHVPACFPFKKVCSKCGNLNKVKAIPHYYYNLGVNGRMIVLKHRCTKYNPIWGREHTHFVSRPYSVQEILNVVGKDISINTYKKLSNEEEVFITSGDI